MNRESEPIEAINDIRRMMKESSRFLSLSGFSGIFAGVYALLGVAVANSLIRGFRETNQHASPSSPDAALELQIKLLVVSGIVLLLSVATAFYLSGKKARKNNQRLFDHSSKQLLWTMAVPLLAGGFFCFALLLHGGPFILLLSPAMLLFYGLALVNSSRFTLPDIRYLGYFEILLGVLAAFFSTYGLLFWALGFGLMHIIYGSIMWFKYDRQ